MTKQEMRNILLSDENELTKLKQFYTNKYSHQQNTNYSLWDDEKFVNWLISDIDINLRNDYIELPNHLIKDFEKDYIPFNNKFYVKVSLYLETETNLSGYYILEIGSFSRILLSEYEANYYYDKLLKDLDLSKFTHSYNNYNEIKRKMFKTLDDFYGSYIENDEKFVDVSLSVLDDKQHPIYTICFSGNDDYSISQDFLNIDKANELWEKFEKSLFVNKIDLPNHYFSN